jgi:hypothetical protein
MFTQFDCLRLVFPEFHQEFIEFVETGDAGKEFLAYMDSDAQCQEAVEMAFTEETESLREAVRFIRWKLTKGRSNEGPPTSACETSITLSNRKK